MIKIKKRTIRQFIHCNILKTLWFNFKVLPFKQAVKLPFFIFGKSEFRNLSGEITIKSNIWPGMILIGKNDYYTGTYIQKTIWNIRGKMIFNGPIKFLHGTYILVSDNATLNLGTGGTLIGSDTKIMCFDNITIGNDCRIAWECQLIDSSFHYTENIETNIVLPLTKPIIIGDKTWIGNRSTISKGSVIPDYTIVASNSLVNKDFSTNGPYTMLAGTPAKTKASNIKRIFDKNKEKELDSKFNYTRTHL